MLFSKGDMGSHLCRRCLLRSSSTPTSCLIRPCSNMMPSIVTGVTEVTGVTSTSSQGHEPATLSPVGIKSSDGGLGVLRSTLSGSNGNKPVAAHPARMFLLVNARSLAGAYTYVKCSLPIASTPPRFSR
jgi:hypothetical protein